MSVELTFQQEFALLIINRPDSLNALNFALLDDIAVAIDRVGNSEARALIVTGAGERAFSAGADITELVDRPLAAQREGALRGQAAFAGLDRLRVPSVALVNGYAFGGGAELALACTFRLATANAKFGLPEIKLGLIPGYGGTQRLPRLIGQARAMELILTGRTVAAEEALAIGLVNRLVEAPALDPAFAFAREFTGHSLMALQFARDAVRRGCETSLADGLKIEADLSTLAYRTADAEEGMRAFLDKRSPRFEDR
jgi:enoyl-CoA hydratase